MICTNWGGNGAYFPFSSVAKSYSLGGALERTKQLFGRNAVLAAGQNSSQNLTLDAS